MKRAADRYLNTGFTIVEVMIVLAISGAILLSAILLVNGRQAKIEFTTAINDVQSQIQQTINDITNGYYPYTSSLSNALANNSVSCEGFQGTGQGSNQGCIFIGKAMQFAVAGSPQQVEISTVIGKQLTSTGQQSWGYGIANAQIAADSFNNPLSATSYNLQNGITVASMYYCPNNVSVSNCNVSTYQMGAVAFLGSLASYSGGSLNSGSQQLYLIPTPDAKLSQSVTAATGLINQDLNGSASNSSNWADSFTNAAVNSPRSVNICFASATTNQSGLISIINGGGQLTTTLSIKAGKVC